LNHDAVSRPAAAVALVDRPDEAAYPALGREGRKLSIVGADRRAEPILNTVACAAAVVAQLAIAFVAKGSRRSWRARDPDVAEAIVRSGNRWVVKAVVRSGAGALVLQPIAATSARYRSARKGAV
jgi:hypothetical protein